MHLHNIPPHPTPTPTPPPPPPPPTLSQGLRLAVLSADVIGQSINRCGIA